MAPNTVSERQRGHPAKKFRDSGYKPSICSLFSNGWEGAALGLTQNNTVKAWAHLHISEPKWWKSSRNCIISFFTWKTTHLKVPHRIYHLYSVRHKVMSGPVLLNSCGMKLHQLVTHWNLQESQWFWTTVLWLTGVLQMYSNLSTLIDW